MNLRKMLLQGGTLIEFSVKDGNGGNFYKKNFNLALFYQICLLMLLQYSRIFRLKLGKKGDKNAFYRYAVAAYQ